MSSYSQFEDDKDYDMVQDEKLAQNSSENEARQVSPGAGQVQDIVGRNDVAEIPTPEPVSWGRHMSTALRLLFAGVLLCSVAYPAVVTLVSQTLWRANAQGSIVGLDGEAVGAELIGQPFSSDVFFHPRPSSKGYDGLDSGSQNLGPLNEALTERVRRRLAELQEEGIAPARVPADWVTESGSGLDPHITPAAAHLQIPRVSRATGLSPAALEELIEKHTEGKFIGFFGWERVNVLLLNLDVQTRLGEQS